MVRVSGVNTISSLYAAAGVLSYATAKHANLTVRP